MSKLDLSEDTKSEGPEELVARTFSRCQNYPRERLGVLGLAQGLRKASDTIGVAMELIVERCAETSPFCPTDADLYAAGRLIHDELQRKEKSEFDQQAEWRKQYGPPKPFRVAEAVAAVDGKWEDRDREMWKQIRQHLKVVAPTCKDVPWAKIYRAMHELGYELTGEQKRMMGGAL